MTRLNYTVPPAYDGARVQDFLRRTAACPGGWSYGSREWREASRPTGVPMRTIDRLRGRADGGPHLSGRPRAHRGRRCPLAVVYEDAHLLMVDKPPYLAVHPSAGKPDPTLANGVVAYYEKKGEAASFRPVNRLDRNTSGLLLAAKDPHTAFLLTRKPEKVYLAVVFGRLEGEGTIDAPIPGKGGLLHHERSGAGRQRERDPLAGVGIGWEAHPAAAAARDGTYPPDPGAYGLHWTPVGGRYDVRYG